jgi:hypothetical protein
MRLIDRGFYFFLATLLVLSLASSASAHGLLEIEIRATGLVVQIENGDVDTYADQSMIAVGSYDPGDVTEVDPGAGLVPYVPVDLNLTFSGAGSFTTIGLGVWDLDDPETPFGVPSLLVSDVARTIGFLLATDPDPTAFGFDLTQPFALASFPLLGAFSGPFPTTSGHVISLTCGSGDLGVLEECGRFSVEIREAAIPEPTGALLFAVGLGVTGARLRRRSAR